jgi:hypothetical protein
MSSVTKTNAPGSGPTSPSGPASGKTSRPDGGRPATGGGAAVTSGSDYWGKQAAAAAKSDPTDKSSPDYDRVLDPSVSDDDLTDPEYLRRQGERAKAAIMGAAGSAKASAVDGAKGLVAGFKGPGGGGSAGDGSAGGGSSAAGAKDKAVAAVRDHPWYAIGGATAVGFLGAIYLNPSRFGRLRGRIKKLEARLAKQEKAAHAAGGRHDSAATHEAAKAKATKTSLWTSLGTMAMGEAMRNLKPFLTDRIAPLMAGLGGQHPQQDQDAGGMYGNPGGIPPEMMAALRARYGGAATGSAASGPAYGGQAPPDVGPGGGMPPSAGSQIPPRSAGDPSI